MATKKQAGKQGRPPGRSKQQHTQRDQADRGRNDREGYDDNFGGNDEDRYLGRYAPGRDYGSYGDPGDEYGRRRESPSWREQDERRYAQQHNRRSGQAGYAGEDRGYRGRDEDRDRPDWRYAGDYDPGMYHGKDWGFDERANYGRSEGRGDRYNSPYRSQGYGWDENRSRGRFDEDPGYYREDYEDRYRERSYPRGNWPNENYGRNRQSGYNENERWQDQRHSREDSPGRHRVVGRGMYGNNPSGRYGTYGGDTMHGNMGGGSWESDNEYQVGGGTAYQPSESGSNYGNFAGSHENWREDQPPGRKFSGTTGEPSTKSTRGRKKSGTPAKAGRPRGSKSGSKKNGEGKSSNGKGSLL